MKEIEFRTSLFKPFLAEECQVNPGAYGFELALGICQGLAKQKIYTSYPNSEDWGWFIEYIENEVEVLIGVGCSAAEGDGYKEGEIDWKIFFRPSVSLMDRLKGVKHDEAVNAIADRVASVLADFGIKSQIQNA